MRNKKRIITCLKNVFTSEKISELSNSKNTNGWDSIGTINLVMEIEKQFKIKIKTNEIIKIQSFREIREILEKKGIKFN